MNEQLSTKKKQTYDNESPALPSNNSLYHTNQIITQRMKQILTQNQLLALPTWKSQQQNHIETIDLFVLFVFQGKSYH